jgi:hypothetical protein
LGPRRLFVEGGGGGGVETNSQEAVFRDFLLPDGFVCTTTAAFKQALDDPVSRDRCTGHSRWEKSMLSAMTDARSRPFSLRAPCANAAHLRALLGRPTAIRRQHASVSPSNLS